MLERNGPSMYSDTDGNGDKIHNQELSGRAEGFRDVPFESGWKRSRSIYVQRSWEAAILIETLANAGGS
jgi:hypothetical protein